MRELFVSSKIVWCDPIDDLGTWPDFVMYTYNATGMIVVNISSG